MLEVKHTERGFADFIDDEGFAAHVGIEDGRLRIGLNGTTPVMLIREQMSSLLPLLQRFVETGEIE